MTLRRSTVSRRLILAARAALSTGPASPGPRPPITGDVAMSGPSVEECARRRGSGDFSTRGECRAAASGGRCATIAARRARMSKGTEFDDVIDGPAATTRAGRSRRRRGPAAPAGRDKMDWRRAETDRVRRSGQSQRRCRASRMARERAPVDWAHGARRRRRPRPRRRPGGGRRGCGGVCPGLRRSRDPRLRRRGREPHRRRRARRRRALVDRRARGLRLRHRPLRRWCRGPGDRLGRRRARCRSRRVRRPAPGQRRRATARFPASSTRRSPSWSTERKVELAKAIEAAARGADERIEGVETTVYVDESSRIALASSTGLRGEAEATSCYAFLQAIAADGGDKQTGLGFGIGRSPGGLDAEAIGREAAERADSLLGAAEAALAHLPGRPRRDRRRQLLRLHRRPARAPTPPSAAARRSPGASASRSPPPR